MNFQLSQQPLPCIPAIADCHQSNSLPAATSENAAQGIHSVPLQIHNPLPLEVNAVIVVAGGEVCHGEHNKKVGREWAMGTKTPTIKINWREQEAA